MSEALIFDTETTGQKEPRIIEAAHIPVKITAKNVVVLAGEGFCQRYNPGKPSELGALATHHILDEELADCPSSDEFKLPEGLKYLIGHNVDFDWEVAGKPEVKRICTLALARKAWPEVDSHKQSALIYMLYPQAKARQIVQNAHSAEADVHMCLDILAAALIKLGTGASTWEQVWEVSEWARVPTHMTFGKHNGMAIADLPKDYKQWILRQQDMDPYVKKAVADSMGGLR